MEFMFIYLFLLCYVHPKQLIKLIKYKIRTSLQTATNNHHGIHFLLVNSANTRHFM